MAEHSRSSRKERKEIEVGDLAGYVRVRAPTNVIAPRYSGAGSAHAFLQERGARQESPSDEAKHPRLLACGLRIRGLWGERGERRMYLLRTLQC